MPSDEEQTTFDEVLDEFDEEPPASGIGGLALTLIAVSLLLILGAGGAIALGRERGVEYIPLSLAQIVGAVALLQIVLAIFLWRLHLWAFWTLALLLLVSAIYRGNSFYKLLQSKAPDREPALVVEGIALFVPVIFLLCLAICYSLFVEAARYQQKLRSEERNSLS